MFKAANKDSSPSTSIASTPGGSSFLSSQAARLRVTPEGLNLVGVGGVLTSGKLSSSQKDQQQKFFATRSSDGNWNLLMTRPSDPSRLFLVQPAPGHKFQMTGGKVRMENMDSTAESNSVAESSANGCEEDPSTQISTVEGVEQTSRTSKSVAVPVAQLRSSSSGNPPCSSHTQAVSGTNVQTTASAETVQPSHLHEQKKRTFFKTAKDRKALRASAEQALGKKANFKNKKGSKSAGTISKQGKMGKVSPHDHCQFPQVSATLLSNVSLPMISTTSTTESTGLPSTSSGVLVTSALGSCVEMSPSSSASGPITSEVSPVVSFSDEQALTLTPQSQGPSHTDNSSAGDEVFNDTLEKDTENTGPSNQQHVVFDEKDAGGEGKEHTATTVTNEDTEVEKALENCSDFQDEQITEKSSNTADSDCQSPSDHAAIPESNICTGGFEVDKSQPGIGSSGFGKSLNSEGSGLLCSEESGPNKSSEKDSEVNTIVRENCQLTCDLKLSKAMKNSKGSSQRRLKKAPEISVDSDSSSDTDHYEFAPSDSENEANSEDTVRKTIDPDNSFTASITKGSISLKDIAAEGMEVAQAESLTVDEFHDEGVSNKQSESPDSTEEHQTDSHQPTHRETHATVEEGNTLAQAEKEVNESLHEDRTSEDPCNQPVVCQAKTLPESIQTSMDHSYTENLSRVEQRESHCKTKHLPLHIAKKRQKERCVIDENINIWQQGHPGENQADTENHELKPEQNKTKKRKKRKSELENLKDTMIIEAGTPGTSDEVVVDDRKERETVSEMITMPASHSSGQERGPFGKKKKLKICINLNKGKSTNIPSTEGSVDDENTFRRVSPSVQDTATSESVSETADGNGLQCLPQADQEQFKSKETEIESLSNEDQDTVPKDKEPEKMCLSHSDNQDGEMSNERQTSVGSKGKIKRKKKLRAVIRNNLFSPTIVSPSTEKTDSGSLNDLNGLSNSHSDHSVRDLQTVTTVDSEAGAGGVPQKKKRKKRLSELETLIHDQAAYVVQTDAIEENSTQEMDGVEENCTQDAADKEMENVHDKETENVHDKDKETENIHDKETENVHDMDREIMEVDQSEIQNEPEKSESSVSKDQPCKRRELEMADSSEVVGELASGSATNPPSSPSTDIQPAVTKQRPKEDTVSEQKSTTERVKRKYKKRKKKIPTAGVIRIPSAALGEKESTETTDSNCYSKDPCHLDGCDLSEDIPNVTDTEDDEAGLNRAMNRFLTSRSFGKWELARMFGTPFVVLERLSDQEVCFMSRRFRNARVSGRARCSAHCRLRTLDYLCELNLISCKPPPAAQKKASEAQKDAACDTELFRSSEQSPKKKRKRKITEGNEKDEEGKKKRKRRRKRFDVLNSDGDGDVIIISDPPNKTTDTSANVQGSGNATSSASNMASFPSASFGRFRITRPPAPLVVTPSQIATCANPSFVPVPPLVASRTSSVPQIVTIPSFGGANRPHGLPQLISISSLGSTVNTASRIILPPLQVNSTASLRDATRASLTQAISNSLCKTRLVTPSSAAPLVALTPSVSPQSASILPTGPIVVQAVSQSSSALPKGPIIVTVPPPAPVLTKVPPVVQSSMSSSTPPVTQSSASTPKQFFVVQMGDKRVLVPAAALNSAATTNVTLSSPLTAATTVTAACPVAQSSVNLSSVSVQQSAGPMPTVITAPAPTIRQQAAALAPGSMARIVLANNRPNTIPPRTGPTASTLLFANRAPARPNQAWSGPRTVDSNRRVIVSPNSQSQGVRVVLSGAGSLSSGTRFTMSGSRSGVFVASRLPNTVVKPSSPRQSCPGKRVMTEEERLRKRARLEKKYPLPPGVVIKTEPESRGYSDEGKTTQANSSARVYVSTVPAGSASRTQVNLTQPIPVLSAFRGNPIIIRQAVPTSSSVPPRSTSLLGPLIIRMPNASASTSTSSLLASCATSTITAGAASSRLTTPSRVSNTTTSTIPLTYSLLSGNTGVTTTTVPSVRVAVTSSASQVSLSSQASVESNSSRAVSCASVVSVSSAPTTVPSGSVEAVSDCQQSTSEDDAIYISDSPPPVVQTSQSTPTSHSEMSVESTTVESSAAQGSSDEISLPCTSVTSAPVSTTAAASPISTTVVDTTQSPVMFTSAAPSTSTSTPSSRMASLGAMWVRQATESPSSIPSIDTRSLQSERMQRLKEMLAKKMENVGDERRQKALQALHQQFCQTASAENTVDSSQLVSGSTESSVQGASNNTENFSVNDSSHQQMESSDGASEVGQIDESSGSADSDSSDQRGESVDRVIAEVHSDAVVMDSDQESSRQDTVVDSLSQQDQLQTGDVTDTTTADDVLVLDSDGAEGPQPSMALGDSGEPSTSQDNMSQMNAVLEQDGGDVLGALSNEKQTEGNTDSGTGCSESGDVNLSNDRISMSDEACIRDTSYHPGENYDGDALSQVTDDSEIVHTERNSDVDDSVGQDKSMDLGSDSLSDMS